MTMMAKFNLSIMTLLAVLLFTACDPEENGGVRNERTDLISFTFVGDKPVIAAPDEEVFYTFKVGYPNGLASMTVSLDGEVLEGTEMMWDDAPTEAQYSFKYLVKGSQYGQTLDFVFTATGVDGYSQSVDYPLWISANEVEFTVALPEKLPSQIYSNESVDFEVNVTCGNVLKSLTVTKDGAAYASKTDFASTEKTLKYKFEYVPSSDDIGKNVEFHFVVVDVKGNEAEAYFSISVVKADVIGKELYEEIFDTSMSISGTTAFNTTEGGIVGGAATNFNGDVDKVVKYNKLLVDDPDNPGAQKSNPGAMEGCTVYDGDVSTLIYSSDGADVCLSKYSDARWTEITGTYLWYRKAKNGWFRVDGIRLHEATSLKLSYTQSTPKGKIKVEYSVDGGAEWIEIIATDTVALLHEKKFTLEQASETISLRFTENGGADHVRVDNIKLVEVL